MRKLKAGKFGMWIVPKARRIYNVWNLVDQSVLLNLIPTCGWHESLKLVLVAPGVLRVNRAH